MKQENLIKITCDLYKVVSSKVTLLLEKIGILVFNIQAAKSVVLREKKRLFNISEDTVLEEDLTDIIFFYIPMEFEEVVLSLIAKEAELNHPGRGTIYSETKGIYSEDIKFFDIEKLKEIKIDEKEQIRFQDDFVEITAILQRGDSTDIVRNILDMGICVPRVTFGIGGGIRTRLGLLRIAVPSEKEIVTVLVNRDDSIEIMDNLVEAAKLDQPGKGFMYMAPVRKILINTKFFRGKSKHIASVEQIISAIDDIKGNNNWRRKFSNIESNFRKKIKYQKDMINFMIISNDGTLSEIVNKTMKVGASGATIYTISTKSPQTNQNNREESFILPKREMANLAINKKIYDDIFTVVSNIGIFNKECSGIIEISDIIQSCTYLPPQK